MASPFRFVEPLNKISALTMGKPITIELLRNKRIATILLTVTVVKAALGAGNYSIPLPSDGIGEFRFNPTGNVNRRRLASDVFGYTGLNALNRKEDGGTVVYTQVGNNNLSAVPVLIGSPADITQQGLLTANTVTTAVFQLPIIFAEDFRKQYAQAEMMAFITGYADGSGFTNVILEADVQNNANITSVAVSAELEYDELVATAGATIMLSKEKVFQKQYPAAGDVELADALTLKSGEVLQRISLATAADIITKVVVKQGSRILRNYTATQNQALLRKCGFNGDAFASNRFDIEFDVNDDPNSAIIIDPNNELSIVATLATANDAGKLIRILPSVYGAVEESAIPHQPRAGLASPGLPGAFSFLQPGGQEFLIYGRRPHRPELLELRPVRGLIL